VSGAKRSPAPPPPRWKTRVAAALAVGCVGLQLGRRLDLAAASAGLWLLIVLWADRPALRRLFFPKFWAVTVLFALGSGLLLGPRDLDVLGLRLSAQGLAAGALMVCRGVFLFTLVSWAARAVDGGKVARVAAAVGLGDLGAAVSAAFGLLPAVAERLAQRRPRASSRGTGGARRVGEITREVVAEAAELSATLAAEFGGRAAFVVVTGPRGSGKTTALRDAARALRGRGLDVGGVLQPAVEGAAGREGYDLEDAATGERRRLARRGEAARGFDFDPDAWGWAAARLADAKERRDVVVADELGLLEARGEGHLPALAALCRSPGRARLLVAAVREGCLDSLAPTLGRPAAVLTVPVEELDARLADLVGLVGERHRPTPRA
jgi:nucleoside-triphosphatase THEP1